MTIEEAREEARAVANAENIVMAITFNPYDEECSDENKYGYCPAAEVADYLHEEVVETIERGLVTPA